MINHASELETWKEFPNNNKYQVSTCGNVRHAITKIQQKFDVEKLKSTKTRIRFQGFYLHRLIALTFIPNPDNLKEVNHIDGNPYNNHATNLEWITRENNMKHFHANHKYTCKYMRRILLIHAPSNVVERTFNCLEECIAVLNLTITYKAAYAKLHNKCRKKRNTVHKNNYVGVSWSKTNNKFTVYHKKKYYGQFDDEVEAAQHYDSVVRELYGKIAHVNFPAANENQAVVGKKLIFTNANDDAIYKIDDMRFIKFEDNNQSLTYDADASAGAGTMIEWREVREAPKYMVSNTGQVKQKKFNRCMKGYLINGYRSVSLKCECPSGAIHRLVHRLVACAFHANDDPFHKTQVDHIDTNILNNDSSNLRWVTPKENMNNELTKHNIRVGLKKSKN